MTGSPDFSQRLQLIQRLSSLPGPQLGQVIFALKPTMGNIPTESAPPASRVNALLEWAESEMGCGLAALEQALDAVLAKPDDTESLSSQSARVFISYRAQEPDQTLAQTLYNELEAAGYQPFLAGSSLQLGDRWAQRILQELEQSDYFILLLSPQSITSEMVMDEVKQAKELQERRGDQRPIILPIRVQFPLESPLTYNLRGYLNQIHQRLWQSPQDTPTILAEVLQLIASGKAPPAVEPPETQQSFADTPDDPPLPVAEPELRREPGGAVTLKSGLYVERYSTETGKANITIEADCFDEITQPGALIRIKAPRQMGKTSLMARILHHAENQGYQTITVSMQRADSTMFSDLDQLLRWLCSRVGRRLKRLDELDNYWDPNVGIKDRCNDYFFECLLEEIDEPIVLALDEVDLVFPHRVVADDFFGLLRSWYKPPATAIGAANCGKNCAWWSCIPPKPMCRWKSISRPLTWAKM
ncbi:MAG: AAA-like domain-containing protein [Cyanobacteria bacterium J06638_6]